jgi:hypothetical protein
VHLDIIFQNYYLYQMSTENTMYSTYLTSITNWYKLSQLQTTTNSSSHVSYNIIRQAG